MTGADTPEDDDDRALAGEYVLGLMPADEARAFAARLASEPALAAEVARWQADLAHLADEVAPVAPPARVWRATRARLFGTRRAWITFGLPLAAAAAVLVAILLAPGLFSTGPVAPADPAYRAEIAAEDGSLALAAAYDAGTGALFVERRAGTPAPGRAFQLWIIAGDGDPISLGVLPDDWKVLSLAIAPDLWPDIDGATLAVSDEPLGGSPTGQPTGAVLAAGTLTAA